ncbi:MAG: glycosyltransferase family 39 protein, partial [Acidimicrobiia bacterium]|nr:glycosyltransferase family 39 protein [Acidimicrobiia bacterium]
MTAAAPVAPSTPGSDDGGARRLLGVPVDERRIAIGMLALVVTLSWLPAMFWSLSTDELLTSWVTSDGIGDAASRAQEFQGNSPLYFVALWAWRQLAGASPAALRLPSLLAVLAALFHLVRFGRELSGRNVGWLAVLGFLGSYNLVARGVSARPYGLLLLGAVVSARYAWRWIHEGRARDSVVSLLSLVVCVYLTPFAVLAGVGHLVAILDARRRARVVALRHVLLLALGGVLACLPLLPQLLSLAARSSSVVISNQPSFAGLVGDLVPVAVAAALGLGLLVAGGRTINRRDPALRFLLAWGLAPGLGLYLVGAIGGDALWVDRYRLAGAPGIMLAAGLLLGRLRSDGRLAAAVLLALVAFSVGANEFPWGRVGYQEALAFADDNVEPGDDAILAMHFELIETADPTLLDDPHWQPYLQAPVTVYGSEMPVVSLPQGQSEAGD